MINWTKKIMKKFDNMAKIKESEAILIRGILRSDKAFDEERNLFNWWKKLNMDKKISYKNKWISRYNEENMSFSFE